MKNSLNFRLLVAALAVLALPAMVSAQTQTKRRAQWTTSRITGAPEPPKAFVSQRIFPGLALNQPVELVAVPGTNRLLALEVAGKIFSFENRPEEETTKTDLFGDIQEREPNFGRLYGFAFHPRFVENRVCFISYVLKGDLPDGSRVSRFKVTASDPPRLIPESEEILIRWIGGGHNGAHLQFGPEGYLYISTGDAGSAFPPDGRNTGQDISDLEASILRIDVDRREAGRAYRIPPDNPFFGRPNTREEVWAYGLRNPWKMAFDPADGSLWAGDVGWELWEMLYCIERGANYGWSVVEGPQPVHQERQTGPTPISPPAVAHSHIEARSITGGYVSQTLRLPDLRGTYVYGDYVTGKIWGVRHEGSKVTWREELVDTPLQIVSFGIDQAGDVLIIDYPTGTLHRLAPNPRRGANDNFPRKLSETGLFADTAAHVPAAGVVPYRVSAEPWADGTTAERLVGLPGDSALGIHEKANPQIGALAGEWSYPDGSVLCKTISIELEPGKSESKRRLETQVLHFDVDAWKGYNYIWNEDQTDAVLAEDVGSERALIRRGDKQTWHHASRTECLLCHTTRVGSVLGFRPPLVDDQLASFSELGLLAQAPGAPRYRVPDPHDETQPLEARARAYLHVNCGHCHTRGGGGSAFFDVQYHQTLARTSLIGARPTQGTFGILGAEIVAPGDPYRSVLYYRMSKLGHGRMPQFGSGVVDEFGTKLIRDWIASLGSTPEALPPNKSVKHEREADRAFVLAMKDTDFTDRTFDLALTSPSRALLTIDELGPKHFFLSMLIRRGYGHSDPAIRDLFERFVPEEKRVARLGGAIQSQAILTMSGNAERGRELFLKSAGVQCKNCHKVGSEGQTLGPELSQIGKKLDKAKLLESILEPSKTIDPQFVSHLVETTGGEVHTGLLVRRTEAEVVLKKADLKEVAIPMSEVERSVPQQKSLMPDLLMKDMTLQQAADLLEFLVGLK